MTRVHVLYTGGTFGMTGRPLRPMELAELERALPKAGKLVSGVEVVLERFERLIDSSSITPAYWVNIARHIERNYEAFDGFVIIHGTDTLAYTASALAFMLEDLRKPVVITGSMLPLLEEGTDAIDNYRLALMVAGHRALGLPAIPEVCVAFAGRVLRGCRSRKMGGRERPFDSPHYPPLAKLQGETLRLFPERLLPMPEPGATLRVQDRLDTDVLDITLYPGLRPETLRAMLALPQARGVVLRAYGAGNAPEDEAFLAALEEAMRERGRAVLVVSQTPYGKVALGHYAASSGLLRAGVISGADMTPEAAITKLMTVMAQAGDDTARIKELMQQNLRGEMGGHLAGRGFYPRPERFFGL